MSDSVARRIMRILVSRKGASAPELFHALPDRWVATDDPYPVHLLFPSLIQLEQWGLIEAYVGSTLVDSSKLSEALWSRDYRKIRFFLSPTAVAMEATLGLNLSGHYQPIFGPPSTKDWPEVFVLMPFGEHLSPVYHDHLKSTAIAAGLSVGRADDFFTIGSIIQDIWSAIYHARVIISDCTGRNPNVFYETGIAHTLGRPTILLAQSLDDIPFDLRHLRTLVYEFTPRGMAKLEANLATMLRAALAGSHELSSYGPDDP